jgi:GT2 family glycosyltransferase
MSLKPRHPLISIVIPNYNGARYLERCLKSLLSQTRDEMEIIVVDNASQDHSVAVVQTFAPQAILLVQKQNLGFAGGVNAGIQASRGEWVAVLNNDTEVQADWLSECARAIQAHSDAVFFACRILDFGDSPRLYSAGDCFLRAGVGYRRGQEQMDREEFHQECEIFSASGCAALYRKSALEAVGGFDERFFAYLEDVDLGLRLQAAGRRGYYLPRAEVYHHGGGTSGGEFSPLSVRLRTRNALLLLIKSVPGSILLRCLPMIFLMQLSWLLRVAYRGRLESYMKGLWGAVLLAPAMIRDRAGMRRQWRQSHPALWRRIVQSEFLARNDFKSTKAQPASLFLKWYFRLF